MKRSLALACIFLSALLVGRAQDSTASNKTSSLSGTVVKEPGSEPLKKVLVQIVAENQKEGGNYTATTDADGRFHVDNVAPGRYRIFFERTGFVEVNGRGLKADTNAYTIREGQPLEDLLFRMLPTAVISGRVTDEDGDPMSEVRIVVQKRRPGKTGRESVAAAGTNDLGEYRISGLFPGQYWIIAIPPPDARDYEKQEAKTPANGTAGEARQDTRYLTTYYPGTYDATQASLVTLKAGDEMLVSLTLIPARTYRVCGIVTGVSAAQKASVELASKGGDSGRSSEVGPDGRFELIGVGPGSYVIRVTAGTEAQTLTAKQDVNVVAGDVEGLKLTPQATFTITGHLQIADGRGDVTQLSANLRQAAASEDLGVMLSQDFFGANSPVDRYGNFAWKKVNPGDYVAQVFGGEGQGLFLQSAALGGADVTTGFTASGPATIELVVSTKGGIVEGLVVEKEKDVDENHPVANATVVAVPEEKFRKIPERFLVGATDQNGQFAIRGVAPGSYTLYAWRDLEDGIWRDPDFLKSQEANGQSLRVGEGSSQKVMLKISPVAEEWR